MRPWSVLLVCAFLFRTAAAGGGGYSGKDGTGDNECIANVPIPAWAERAAEPYASWQPCDTVATYTEVCDPQPPTCHVEYECEIAQGLGSMLRDHFGREANRAFKDGCSISVRPDNVRCVFDLQKHCTMPQPLVPSSASASRHSYGCNTFALTQPLPHIVDHLTALEAPRQSRAMDANGGSGTGGGVDTESSFSSTSTRTVPVIGLHLRTGWADCMLTQAKHFQELECGAYHDKYATATATAVGFEDENADWVDLDAILTTLANVADSAFEGREWDLFLATDSPKVQTYVEATIASRARKVIMDRSDIPGGHSNAYKLEPDPDHPYNMTSILLSDFGSKAVADLLGLSECDMLFYLMSSFSGMAARRTSFCEGNSKKRSVLMSGALSGKGARSHDTHKRILKVLGKLREYVKGAVVPADAFKGLMPSRQHECLADDNPALSCLCFYKLALG